MGFFVGLFVKGLAVGLRVGGALSAGFNIVGGCIAKERVNLSEGRQENKLMVFSTMLTPVLFG